MDELTKIFAPALEAQKSANAGAKAVPGEVNPSLPTVADKVGATDEKVNTPSMNGLADFVKRHFRINYDYRASSGMDERLRYDIMSQTCMYDARQIQFLESIGINRRVYTPVTATKVRSVKSMLMELANYGADAPFVIDPTPDPDVPSEVRDEVMRGILAEVTQIFVTLEKAGVQQLPPDVMARLQELIAKATSSSYDQVSNAKDEFARNRAKRMQKKVWDLMLQGDYMKAKDKCLDYFCTYGTCVLVGPTLRNHVHNHSVKDAKSGVRKIRRVISSIPYYEALNPVDCYPSPDAVEVTDGAFCVRVRYTKEELWRFKNSSAKDGTKKVKGAEGWRDIAIAKLLSDHEFGIRLTEFPVDREIEMATKRGDNETETCKFEGMRCFSYVDGHKLLSIGITKAPDGTKIDLDGFYYTETIVIGDTVVFCRIYDERMGSPLSKSCFYDVPGSWWGESIADKLFMVQNVMNNAIIALLRNMGFASSSMIWINDVSRMVDKSPNGLTAEAGKVFAFGSSYTGQTSAGAPMGVLQLPSNASDLLSVAKWCAEQADIDSGIPAFSEGTGGSNGGALRTAEGLRTFTEHASRGVKMIASSLDRGIICTPAKMTADWVLVYDDDMDLKGDVEVRSTGIMAKILKSQNDQARLQLFNLCLNSQLMQNILGVSGILALFRPSLKDINVNPDDVVPSKERLEFIEQVEKIKQLAAAANAETTIGEQQAEAQGQPEGQGMNPGVQPIANVGGGVSGRRGAA